MLNLLLKRGTKVNNAILTREEKQSKNWSEQMLPKNYEELVALCKILVESRCIPSWHYKQESPYSSVLACVLKGAELGWPIMASIQSILRVNGCLTVWGDALLATIKVSPDYEYLIERFDLTTTTATCIGKRKGEPEAVTRTFSREDAQKAGLYVGSDGKKRETYHLWEKRMLQLRARAFCIRDTWPHLLYGLSLAEDFYGQQGVEIDLLSQKIELETEKPVLLEEKKESPQDSILKKFKQKADVNELEIDGNKVI